VGQTLQRALSLARKAGAWHRADRDVRDQPAPMLLEILDALVVLRSRGCPAASDELVREVVGNVKALQGSPQWTSALARRHTDVLAALSAA